MTCAWWSTLLSMCTGSATASPSGSMRGRGNLSLCNMAPAHQGTLQCPWGIPIWVSIQTSHPPCVLFWLSVQFWMLYLEALIFSGTDLSRFQGKIGCYISFLRGKGFKPVWVQSLGIADICWCFSFMVCDPGSACLGLEWAWESPEGAGWTSCYFSLGGEDAPGVFQQPLLRWECQSIPQAAPWCLKWGIKPLGTL